MRGWGLIKVIERAKIGKKRECAAFILGLRGFGGYFMVWVYLVWRVENSNS